MIRNFSRLGPVAAFAALLVACAPSSKAPPGLTEGAPTDFPHAHYRQLQAQGKPVFGVDAARSQVVIEVRRGGALARLGHDHVVASHAVAGNIAPDEGRADFYVRLDALMVDEPDLRARAGFDTQPDADDIAGTRRNMLQKVLQTDQYPYAVIRVSEVGTGGMAVPVRVVMTLHGVTRAVETIARWDRSAEDFSVSGTFAIDQTEFGMTPLSVLGGAITVQDRVNIAFLIHAHRMNGASR